MTVRTRRWVLLLLTALWVGCGGDAEPQPTDTAPPLPTVRTAATRTPTAPPTARPTVDSATATPTAAPSLPSPSPILRAEPPPALTATPAPQAERRGGASEDEAAPPPTPPDPIQRATFDRTPTDATLDPTGTRLFVADAGGDLHVLDPITLIEQTRMVGMGSFLSLDPVLGQIYAGDDTRDGVSVFELSALDPLGRIPQPGRPVASPADGRVYIVGQGVTTADGVTLEIVTQRAHAERRADAFVVHPHTGQVYSTTTILSPGDPGPNTQFALDAQTEDLYVAHTTDGYQPAHSLALYAQWPQKQPDRWIDGLYGQMLYNPHGHQLYLARHDRLLILDADTLDLLSAKNIGDELTLFTIHPELDELYAAQGEQLLRLSPLALRPDTPAPEPVDALPGPVYGIVVSPDFGQDRTLFARATDWNTGLAHLFRSRDGGTRWERVTGGLPVTPNDLAFGPDGQLYAATTPVEWQQSAATAAWGEGVYASDDGGEVWQPASTALAHLRVQRLHTAADGTLYAQTVAAPEPGSATSGPAIWSRPPGTDWTPVPVPEAGPLRLEDYAVPYSYTLAVQVYWHHLSGGGPLYQAWGDELHRSDDGGRTWQTVGPGPGDPVAGVIVGREGVYWVGAESLWRSTDGGITWVALRLPGLDGPPFTLVVADVDGVETLFLGTEDGRVLVVPVDEAVWEAPDR